jgi:preprotein translocase subunit YajC
MHRGWLVDLLLQAQSPTPGPAPAEVPPQAPPNPMDFLRSMMVPLLAMVAIFWFLVWRPEGKKRKDRQSMIQNLKKGDTVVTNGGLIGKVWRADGPGEVVVIVDKDKDVKARFSRSSIFEVIKSDSDSTETARETEERAKQA